MKKRLLSIVLVLVLCIGILPTTVFAASDNVTISASLPATVAPGNTINLSGTVKSTSSNLRYVNAEIYNSSGKLMAYATKSSVNAKTFNLSKLPTLSAKNLPVGTYTLKITAANKSNKTTTCTKKFSVTDSVTIQIRSYAVQRYVGDTTILRGTVTSENSNLTSITMTILDSSKKKYTSWTVTCTNLKSFDLSYLPSTQYGKLPRGTYYYQLTATNESGQTASWTQKFTVK